MRFSGGPTAGTYCALPVKHSILPVRYQFHLLPVAIRVEQDRVRHQKRQVLVGRVYINAYQYIEAVLPAQLQVVYDRAFEAVDDELVWRGIGAGQVDAADAHRVFVGVVYLESPRHTALRYKYRIEKHGVGRKTQRCIRIGGDDLILRFAAEYRKQQEQGQYREEVSQGVNG